MHGLYYLCEVIIVQGRTGHGPVVTVKINGLAANSAGQGLGDEGQGAGKMVFITLGAGEGGHTFGSAYFFFMAIGQEGLGGLDLFF